MKKLQYQKKYKLQNKQIQADRILKKLPANKIIIFLNKFNDLKESLSKFSLFSFRKIDSNPLILTYPPRGMSENLQLVLFLSLKVKRDLPKPIEKSVTFSPKKRDAA